MKGLRKKIIKGREYYYLETIVYQKDPKKQRTISTFIGPIMPPEKELKELIKSHLERILQLSLSTTGKDIQKFFPDNGLEAIERSRMEYSALSEYEPFKPDFQLFKTFFYLLFVLNSHRAEGSKITKKEVEESLFKKRYGRKKAIEIEIQNAIDSMNYAFSDKMQWNILSLKKIHKILLKDLHPEAGKFRKESVTAPTAHEPCMSETTSPDRINTELKLLLSDLNRKLGKEYPPITALDFHWRFEMIHPFIDGNGRVGRIILNAMLLKYGFSPVIFFEESHKGYCKGIEKARSGYVFPLASHFVKNLKNTHTTFITLKKEKKLAGKSARIGEWKIQLERPRISLTIAGKK
jgi:fido (protein-threonine AMPylation protein)